MTSSADLDESGKVSVTRYEIGPDDRLLSISGDWSTFARGNASPEIAGDTVLGTSLLDSIGGPEVRHLVGLLLSRVREGRAEITIPFRCDAPGMRRWMELHLAPSETVDGGVSFESRTIRQEPREPVALLDPSVPRSDRLLSVCAWCRRVEVEGEWREIEVAARALGLFGQSEMPGISHAICAACRRGVEEVLDSDANSDDDSASNP